jgi:hypothetical protein
MEKIEKFPEGKLGSLPTIAVQQHMQDARQQERYEQDFTPHMQRQNQTASGTPVGPVRAPSPLHPLQQLLRLTIHRSHRKAMDNFYIRSILTRLNQPTLLADGQELMKLVLICRSDR